VNEDDFSDFPAFVRDLASSLEMSDPAKIKPAAPWVASGFIQGLRGTGFAGPLQAPP
jgi:hypothetical protein